jgi:pSer/pThr/pTyr-binding forkhead associated (FHA) protein
MSSHHCEVRIEPNGSFKMIDLGSTNGIVVNDKKVREHELVDNDQFRLGRTEFKFKSIG